MAAPRRSAMQAPPWGQEDPQPQEHDTAWEASHQRFRQFQYEDAAGLREAFCQLWELCFQWLRPQTRSVEQILALSVMEKFLQILPADTETRRNMLSPEIRERIFTLIEDLPKDSWGPDTKINMRDMLLEELERMSALLTPTNMHVRPPAHQLMESARELLENPLDMNILANDQLRTLLNIDFHLPKEYKDLEPPGEEPPEQLLSDFKGPQENQEFSEDQNEQEMPEASQEVQIEAPHDEMPLPNEQSALCSVHQQQCNIHLEIHIGNIVQGGPRDEPGPSHRSDPSGHQFIFQEEASHEHAMSSNSFTQAATVSESQAAYTDEERRKCRVCKSEFMYLLGLKELGSTQVAPKPYYCFICKKGFRGKVHFISHQVKHTGERPFMCGYCKKTYKHKSSLMRHFKIHKRENEHKESQGSQSPMHGASQ